MGWGKLIQQWRGLAVVTRWDAQARAWIFVALHDDTLGMPVGGTRYKVYENSQQALTDALRLAEGMTYKWAAVGLDCGGGKAVIAPRAPLDARARMGLLHRYGQLLNTLSSSFGTGQDLGMTPQDMLIIAQHCSNVHGCDARNNTARDAGPYTARGVLACLGAAWKHCAGSADLEGVRVHIEGVGDVGAPLARRLAAMGAQLLLSDLDISKAESLRQELGGGVTVCDTPYPECEIYAPCAVGATLNPDTVPRLRCRVVAGCANNQLLAASDAESLHQRGILYAPDYVVNAGGAIGFGLLERGVSQEEIGRRIDNLAQILDDILEQARQQSESPYHAAQRRAERVLNEGRSG